MVKKKKFRAYSGMHFFFKHKCKINCDQIYISLYLNKEPDDINWLLINVENSKHWLSIPVYNTCAIFFRHTCMWREYSNKVNNSFIAKTVFYKPKKL